MIVLVYRQTRRVGEHPLVRQNLRPGHIDLVGQFIDAISWEIDSHGYDCCDLRSSVRVCVVCAGTGSRKTAAKADD